jgi:hypothetical protein
VIGSYPSIYTLGHRAATNLFDGPVLVQEKVDGSQFSFGIIDGVLRFRSKGQEIYEEGGVPALFRNAVKSVRERADLLQPGWIYRGEYLSSPHHNTLTYERIPEGHIALFDIQFGNEDYAAAEFLALEAKHLHIGVVPTLETYNFNAWDKSKPSMADLESLLHADSFLGGQKVEGVVFKNYTQYGVDKKVLMAKHVSEAFKEVHRGAWKEANPGKAEIIDRLVVQYRTPARWQKAVQHLAESGTLDNSPRDIGPLMKEVHTDVLKECEDEIKEALFKYAWPKISRGIAAGLPEWYKTELAASQLDAE